MWAHYYDNTGTRNAPSFVRIGTCSSLQHPLARLVRWVDNISTKIHGRVHPKVCQSLYTLNVNTHPLLFQLPQEGATATPLNVWDLPSPSLTTVKQNKATYHLENGSDSVEYMTTNYGHCIQAILGRQGEVHVDSFCKYSLHFACLSVSPRGESPYITSGRPRDASQSEFHETLALALFPRMQGWQGCTLGQQPN